MSPAARLMSGIILIIVPTIQYGGYFHDADRGIVDRLLSRSTRGGGHDHANRDSSWLQVRSGVDVRHTERRWPPSSGAPYCAGTNDSAASACTIGVLTRNQMAWRAGRNSSVSTVPAAVPPIRVQAIDPQNTEVVSGMNASTAARAVRRTGRARCTVASTTAS